MIWRLASIASDLKTRSILPPGIRTPAGGLTLRRAGASWGGLCSRGLCWQFPDPLRLEAEDLDDGSQAQGDGHEVHRGTKSACALQPVEPCAGVGKCAAVTAQDGHADDKFDQAVAFAGGAPS